MLKRKVRDTLRRAAVYTTGWASLTVGVAFAQELPRATEANVPEGALVFYLSDDDDPPADGAAVRVLRLLQLLGVHRPAEPGRLPPHLEAETELPPWSAPRAELAQTAEAAAVSPDRAWEPPLDDPASAAGHVAPASLVSASARTSAWPAAELRGAPAAAPPLAASAGLTSSRRTYQPAAQQSAGSASPSDPLTAEIAATGAKNAPGLTPPLPEAPALPVASDLAPQRTVSPAPAASLPPLPPLRNGDALLAAGAGDRRSSSAAAPLEPRSADAVLDARPTPLAKTLPAATDRSGEDLAKRAVTAALARLDLPPLERRACAPATPPVLPQAIVVSPRQASAAEDGTFVLASVATPVNTLRDGEEMGRTSSRRVQNTERLAGREVQVPNPPPPVREGNPGAATPASKATVPPPAPAASVARSPTLSPLASPPQLQTPAPAELPAPRPQTPGRDQLDDAAPPAPLRVAVRESRLLRTPENVVRVVPEHDRFCDVLVFNPREVAVIGKQEGTVRVELWYDPQGLKRASYLVAVDNDAQAESLETGPHKIEQLIAYLFPASRIQLVQQQDHLIVRGSAVSRRQAVEIMSTVRRSQLIPVLDEIVVRPEAK